MQLPIAWTVASFGLRLCPWNEENPLPTGMADRLVVVLGALDRLVVVLGALGLDPLVVMLGQVWSMCATISHFCFRSPSLR